MLKTRPRVTKSFRTFAVVDLFSEIAQKAKVKKLMLGHLSSRYENSEGHLLEATQIFKDTIVAEDGMVIELL